MSNWKKDRLTIEVKESEKKIMAEAAARQKAEAKDKEDKAWRTFQYSLYSGDMEYDCNIDTIVSAMIEAGYEVPKKKIDD